MTMNNDLEKKIEDEEAKIENSETLDKEAYDYLSEIVKYKEGVTSNEAIKQAIDNIENVDEYIKNNSEIVSNKRNAQAEKLHEESMKLVQEAIDCTTNMFGKDYKKSYTNLEKCIDFSLGKTDELVGTKFANKYNFQKHDETYKRMMDHKMSKLKDHMHGFKSLTDEAVQEKQKLEQIANSYIIKVEEHNMTIDHLKKNIENYKAAEERYNSEIQNNSTLTYEQKIEKKDEINKLRTDQQTQSKKMKTLRGEVRKLDRSINAHNLRISHHVREEDNMILTYEKIETIYEDLKMARRDRHYFNRIKKANQIFNQIEVPKDIKKIGEYMEKLTENLQRQNELISQDGTQFSGARQGEKIDADALYQSILAERKTYTLH